MAHNDILDSLYEREIPDNSTIKFRRNVIITLMFILIIEIFLLAIQVIEITYVSKINITEIVNILKNRVNYTECLNITP
jgi:hypothetical protein